MLYQHGAFTAERHEIATKNALLAFSVGLPAFLAVKIFAPGFYANHDTKTPFKIAVVCVAVNLFFNLILMGPLPPCRHGDSPPRIASWVNLGCMGYHPT